jgi:hypothetical protein
MLAVFLLNDYIKLIKLIFLILLLKSQNASVFFARCFCERVAFARKS